MIVPHAGSPATDMAPPRVTAAMTARVRARNATLSDICTRLDRLDSAVRSQAAGAATSFLELENLVNMLRATMASLVAQNEQLVRTVTLLAEARQTRDTVRDPPESRGTSPDTSMATAQSGPTDGPTQEVTRRIPSQHSPAGRASESLQRTETPAAPTRATPSPAQTRAPPQGVGAEPPTGPGGGGQ